MYNNLNDYYSANGGANTWNSATRTADAKRAGIQNYAGTADQNSQLLSFLSNPSATSPKSTYVANKAGTPSWQSDLNSVMGASTTRKSSPYDPIGAPNQSTVNGPVYNPPPFEPYTAAPNMSTNQGPARGNPDGSITYNTPSGAYTAPRPAPAPAPIMTPYNRDTAGASYIPPGTPVSSAPSTPAQTFVQNRVDGGAPTASAPSSMTSSMTSSSSSTSGSGGVGGGGTGGGAPAMGPMGGAVSAADKAFEDYLKSLTETDEEKEAKKYLDTLNVDANLANERALNSGETMGFAGGEAQRVNRNNDIRIAGAAARVEALAARRGVMTTAQKARLDYEQGKIKSASEGAFELSAGQSRFNRDGSVVASMPRDTSNDAYRQAQIDNIYSDNANRNTGTAAERRTEARAQTYSEINGRLQAGVTDKDGKPYIDAEGFMTKDGFFNLLAASQQLGITRAEFLKEFGSFLGKGTGKYEGYRLTAQESNLLLGR